MTGDEEEDDDIVVLTASEIMMLGLNDVNFTKARVNRVKGNPATSKTNVDRFRNHYGVNPVVVAALWEDLQSTTILESRWEVKKKGEISQLFECLHFLKAYKTESNMESTFDRSPKTVRKHIWTVLSRIQALKQEKIVFPDYSDSDDIWIMTVDGINFARSDQRPCHL